MHWRAIENRSRSRFLDISWIFPGYFCRGYFHLETSELWLKSFKADWRRERERAGERRGSEKKTHKAEGTTRPDPTRAYCVTMLSHASARKRAGPCVLGHKATKTKGRGQGQRVLVPSASALRRRREGRDQAGDGLGHGSMEELAATRKNIQGTVASVALAAALFVGAGAETLVQQPPSALAELNAREYERGGEFNRGSAMQFGGVDMKKVDIVKEFGKDLRLSNFVQADIRDAKLKQANLRGAYMMKVSQL